MRDALRLSTAHPQSPMRGPSLSGVGTGVNAIHAAHGVFSCLFLSPRSHLLVSLSPQNQDALVGIDISGCLDDTPSAAAAAGGTKGSSGGSKASKSSSKARGGTAAAGSTKGGRGRRTSRTADEDDEADGGGGSPYGQQQQQAVGGSSGSGGDTAAGRYGQRGVRVVAVGQALAGYSCADGVPVYKFQEQQQQEGGQDPGMVRTQVIFEVGGEKRTMGDFAVF